MAWGPHGGTWASLSFEVACSTLPGAAPVLGGWVWDLQKPAMVTDLSTGPESGERLAQCSLDSLLSLHVSPCCHLGTRQL